jgi:hypothetical protein
MESPPHPQGTRFLDEAFHYRVGNGRSGQRHLDVLGLEGRWSLGQGRALSFDVDRLFNDHGFFFRWQSPILGHHALDHTGLALGSRGGFPLPTHGESDCG